MRKQLKHVKNEKGLTLVELLAVIVILGIIAAIAVPAIGNIIDNTRKDAHIANAESIYNAARLAIIAENQAPPVEYNVQDELVPDFLQSMPTNPEDNNEVYEGAVVIYDGENYYVQLEDSEGPIFSITDADEDDKETYNLSKSGNDDTAYSISLIRTTDRADLFD